jgi:hypothetical protein
MNTSVAFFWPKADRIGLPFFIMDEEHITSRLAKDSLKPSRRTELL